MLRVRTVRMRSVENIEYRDTSRAAWRDEDREMSSPEFGITMPMTGLVQFAREAERSGYDYLTSGDHVAFHSPQSNAFVALSVAAGATERIKLLSSATLLPLYPAALVAKMAAMLDSASGGRFNLGVGIGGEYPAEFEACGVPVSQRGARADEALAVIGRLLRETSVTFEGRFSHLHDVTIEPRAVQEGGVPIWVAGRKEAAMRRAARFGDAWMPYMYSPDQLRRSMETLDSYLPEFGRQPGSVRGAIFAWAAVDHDGTYARRLASEVVGEVYNQDFSRLIDRYFIVGSPAECRARLREYADAGASAVMLNLACRQEDMEGMLRLFAEEVLADVRTTKAASTV